MDRLNAALLSVAQMERISQAAGSLGLDLTLDTAMPRGADGWMIQARQLWIALASLYEVVANGERKVNPQ